MKKHTQESVLEFFLKKCKEYRLRVTPQRISIYQELVKAKDHPSAEKMYQRLKGRFPHLSFDTVYRTLLTFAEIGLAHPVEGSGSPRRFDPFLTPHHHMHCIRCDTIFDFHEESYDKLKVPDNIRKKFNILNKKVVLEGICRKCR